MIGISIALQLTDGHKAAAPVLLHVNQPRIDSLIERHATDTQDCAASPIANRSFGNRKSSDICPPLLDTGLFVEARRMLNKLVSGRLQAAEKNKLEAATKQP
jgi:hypothetical protein